MICWVWGGVLYVSSLVQSLQFVVATLVAIMLVLVKCGCLYAVRWFATGHLRCSWCIGLRSGTLVCSRCVGVECYLLLIIV